jgi:tetratricopeptide (TPR) repeat protein
VTVPVVVITSVLAAALAGRAQDPNALVERAEIAFEQGRLTEAVAAFDRVASLVPSTAPMLWQRGIALYYLGRYDECAAQFASFHAIDPTDLENASWHFLCVARGQSLEKARAMLLAAGPDPRILRTQVYEMMRGRLAPADLTDLASKSVPLVRFYAHLYVGLYSSAIGDRAAEREHITAAASDDYRSLGGFMNVVAQVHMKRLPQTETTPR